jgi:PAS domain S-box-containing protein
LRLLIPLEPPYPPLVPTPSSDSSGPTPAERVPDLPLSEPMRALVASRDPALLAACSSVFAAADWFLVECEDPERASRLAVDGTFAVIVLDIGLDQLPVALLLRRARQLQPAPLLIVAGPEIDEGLISLVGAGADDLLPQLKSVHDCPATRQLFEQRLRMAAAAAQTRVIRAELDLAHRSLGVQRAFFEQLFESAPEGIVVVDADDRVLRANGEFCRMFGYTHPEILGRFINELIAPPPFATEAAMLTDRVHANESVAIESTRCRADGAPLEVSLLATPIDTPNGTAGAIGIYRDITEQKRAERNLRVSEERYRYLFERNPHPMLIYDTDTLRFLAVNETAVDQYGYSREELLGMTVLDIRPEEDVEAVRKHLARALPGIRLAGLWRHRRRDGTLIWVDVISLSIDFAGRPARLVMASDVTKRKAAETRIQEQTHELERVNQELKQRTVELEHALQARTRLYAAVSHELRTPISAIMLFNDLLLSSTLGRLNREQIEGVEQSQKAARHLLDLVNDVLDLAKAQAGKISITPANVVLADFIDELLVTARPLAASRGSTLSLVMPHTNCSLFTDPRRLRQILLNLISNAAKFGEGKPIELTCTCECAIGGGAVIAVRDSGRGIAPEDHSRIFEDFVQVGGHSEAGTGLGLPIARRLAELLGGTLDLESDLGGGSEFRLVLPVRISPRTDDHIMTLPAASVASSPGAHP